MVDLSVMIVKCVMVCSVCLMGVHVDSGNDDVCVECSLQETAANANVPFLDNAAQSREQYQLAVSHGYINDSHLYMCQLPNPFVPVNDALAWHANSALLQLLTGWHRHGVQS